MQFSDELLVDKIPIIARPSSTDECLCLERVAALFSTLYIREEIRELESLCKLNRKSM